MNNRSIGPLVRDQPAVVEFDNQNSILRRVYVVDADIDGLSQKLIIR